MVHLGSGIGPARKEGPKVRMYNETVWDSSTGEGERERDRKKTNLSEGKVKKGEKGERRKNIRRVFIDVF